MELLQELEVWYVIPALRKELAFVMKNKGIKQVEIAKKLGVTKAAITQYLNDKRGSELKLNPKIKQEVILSASRINTQFDAIREIQHLLSVTREEKVICQIHRNLEKEYNNCNVCFEKSLVNIGARK